MKHIMQIDLSTFSRIAHIYVLALYPIICLSRSIMTMQRAIAIYALIWASTEAFTTPRRVFTSRHAPQHQQRVLYAKPSLVEEAATLRAQAERMRLEAEQMDKTLTLKKIASLETKLNDSAWLEKHPGEKDGMSKQLKDLQNKLEGKPPIVELNSLVSKETTNPQPAPPADGGKRIDELVSKISQSNVLDRRRKVVLSSEELERRRLKRFPISGFDQEDLDLYLPVALEIEATMTNATVDEQLVALRERPNLKDFFQTKIQALLVKPMEDMVELDNLKNRYLQTRSKSEKESIKREMERLEDAYDDDDSPFLVKDITEAGTPPMPEEEMELRLETMAELPQLLQELFKRRNGVETYGSLRLAIELEHYEQQLQQLDQLRFRPPLDDTKKEAVIKILDTIPEAVRARFCETIGLANDSNATDILAKLESGQVFDIQVGQINRVVGQALIPDLPEYGDIDFVERSRYAEEFIPAFTRMELNRPTQEQMDTFTSEVLNKNTFSLTSKPERVIGGYYLRGRNQLKNEVGQPSGSDKLVSALNENLRKSSLSGKMQFFFIQDPTPPTDEDIQTENTPDPILVVTGVNPGQFYNLNQPLNKILISGTGLLSTVVLSLGACELNGFNYDQFNAQLEAYAAGTGDLDISWLTDMAAPVAVALVGIQMVHESSHRFLAWKDKFDIGLPNFIPSLQLGLTGAITPLKSPPPNFRSLFDFSMVGPLSGIAVSLALLISGLGDTIHLDMAQQAALPALPIGLLRTSALGGSLVEMFLGNGVLDASDESVLPLSPLAVAGFLGLITNALALLPLGHTDGGRIALTMFGRRGAFLVKSFTTLLLCAVGLFGLDGQKILVAYAFFVTFWQRELESPMQNEVDELDFGRGFVAIAVALLVALTLLPHN
jgi:hypothetical protein